MLKTKILFQLNSGNKGEILDAPFGKSVKIDKSGLIYFIQIVSTKPIDVLSEK